MQDLVKHVALLGIIMGSTLLCLALLALLMVGPGFSEMPVLVIVIALNALIVAASVISLALYYCRERALKRALEQRRRAERRGAPTLEQWMDAHTPEAVGRQVRE